MYLDANFRSLRISGTTAEGGPVIAGLFRALAEDRELETGDISAAIAETFPLSFTMREEINRIRDWAKGRARSADAPAEGAA